METGKKLCLADVFVSITDPRQAGKVEHNLVELMVVAVNAVLVGADTFVEIEMWANEKRDWLRRYLKLENGIPSHDTRWWKPSRRIMDAWRRVAAMRSISSIAWPSQSNGLI